MRMSVLEFMVSSRPAAAPVLVESTGEAGMIVRKMVGAVFALLLLAQLQGCGTHTWREDVKLGDGRIINVKRVEKYTGWGGIGNSCSGCRFQTAKLYFDLDGKSVEWKSIPLAETPMILDIVGGVPVLVSTTAGGSCVKHLSGDRTYTYFVYSTYRDGAWTQSAKPPFPVVQRRNLHRGLPSSKKDLTITAKEAEVEEIVSRKHVRRYPFYLIVDGAENTNCNPWSDWEDLK